MTRVRVSAYMSEKANFKFHAIVFNSLMLRPVSSLFNETLTLKLNTQKEGCMSYTAPEDAQRPRAVYDIHPDFRGI